MLESWKDRKAKAVPAMLFFCAKMQIQFYRNLKFYKSVYGDGLFVPLNIYTPSFGSYIAFGFTRGKHIGHPRELIYRTHHCGSALAAPPASSGPRARGNQAVHFFLPCRVPCVQFLLSFVVRHHLHSPGGKLEGSGSKKRGEKLRSFTSPG